MACVEEEDCAVQCADRVKRAAEQERDKGRVPREVGSSKGRTEGWQENLEIRVVSLPTDLSAAATAVKGDSVSECRLYLIVTLATALTFCLLSAAIVVFACIRKAREKRCCRGKNCKQFSTVFAFSSTICTFFSACSK